ncbi:MAG: hypothetical protein IKQ59_05115 [Prevotella sp.]|nr:hypothetical protein [Prevotella sp.]
MKKLVLTMVALVAMTTASFAQFLVYTPCSSPQSYRSSFNAPPVNYNVPSVTYSVPSVSYSVPSTVNYNTTTVSGYSRSNGTYVDSHVRTMPNSTNWDNFSTSGNTNPYTGSTGYRARDYSSGAYNYGSGQTIHTGSRGGQYYYNSNGHKTYVPKRNLW